MKITLAKEGHSEITEKKSVFIGSCVPVKCENGAIEYIKGIKKKYSDARHNVYAYSVKDAGIQRYSDDGEPQGTGGLPLLDVIKRSGFDDAVIVVTRYFGGILLGTGGLTRAYSAAATACVADAGIARFLPVSVFSVELSYNDYAKVSRIFEGDGIVVDGTEFAENVTLKYAVTDKKRQSLEGALTELTCGRASPLKIGERFMSI